MSVWLDYQYLAFLWIVMLQCGFGKLYGLTIKNRASCTNPLHLSPVLSVVRDLALWEGWTNGYCLWYKNTDVHQYCNLIKYKKIVHYSFVFEHSNGGMPVFQHIQIECLLVVRICKGDLISNGNGYLYLWYNLLYTWGLSQAHMGGKGKIYHACYFKQVHIYVFITW